MRLTGRLIVVAILMVSFNQVIQLYGLRYITAGLAAVLSSALSPISLLGFAVIVGQERLVWRQVAAIRHRRHRHPGAVRSGGVRRRGST